MIGTVGCQKTNRFETSDEVDFYVLGSDGIIGYQFNDEKLNEILYLIFDYPHKHYTFKYFEV